MSALVFVRDGRTLPFFPVTMAAMEAIRVNIPKRRPYAIATYMALLEFANERRGDRVALAQKSIVDHVGAARTTVQTALADLQTAGVLQVIERSHGPARIENEYVIVEPSDRREESDTPARDTGDPRPSDGQPSRAGEGGLEEQQEPRGENAHDPREHPPEDFPDHLRPHAREVYRVLRAVAEQHGARKVWPQAVGRVLMAHPRHPLVAQAHALAAWAVDPPRPIRDVVGTYRSFLTRERELEATEHLAPDGTPATGKAPAGVTHLRPNASAEERRMARQRERAEKIAEYDRADSQPGNNAAMIALYPTTEEA